MCYSTTVGSATQYARVKAGSVYGGFVMRSTNDPADGGYLVAWFPDSGGQCVVAHFNNSGFDSEISSRVAFTMSATDIIGATIQGTGATTVVNIWRNPTSTVPYDVNNWDSASDPPDAVLNDITAFYCNTGTCVGLGVDVGGVAFDDFYGGSFGVAYVEQESLCPSDVDWDTFSNVAGHENIAMSWTAGASYTLTQASPKLNKAGSPTQTLTAYLYADSGNKPATLLGTSTNTIAASTLAASPGSYVDFQFAGVSIVSGTRYHLVVGGSALDPSNCPQWRYSGSAGGAEYASYSADRSAWTTDESSVQGTFKTYIDAASPSLSPSASPSLSPSASVSPSASASPSLSPSASASPSATSWTGAVWGEQNPDAGEEARPWPEWRVLAPITRIGSVTNWQTAAALTSASVEVTVPSDAELMVVMLSAWANREHPYSVAGEFTLEGQNLTIGADSDTNLSMQQMVWYYVLPPVGTQTLEYTWGASDYPLNFYYAFYKGINTANPVRSFGAQQIYNGGAPSTGVLDAEAGDLVVAAAGAYDSGFNGWTSGAATVVSSENGVSELHYGEGVPTGDVTVALVSLAFGGVAAIVLMPATGAVVVQGDASWGRMEVGTGEPCVGPVVEMGDAELKTITALRDKYETGGGGTGVVTIYVRGSASWFLRDWTKGGNSPEWAEYTAPITQAWRYVQWKLEYVSS
jgi:hypothetical protein